MYETGSKRQRRSSSCILRKIGILSLPTKYNNLNFQHEQFSDCARVCIKRSRFFPNLSTSRGVNNVPKTKNNTPRVPLPPMRFSNPHLSCPSIGGRNLLKTSARAAINVLAGGGSAGKAYPSQVSPRTVVKGVVTHVQL